MQIKAVSADRPAIVPKRTARTSLKLSYLPLDLQLQARELFFAYYIADFSRAWDFLFPHFDPRTAPEHISLSIDAASLAFLSHHIASPSAQIMGRRKYVTALSKINKVLQDPKVAQQASTLEASLLLDLFEKITDSKSNNIVAQRAHVDGALTLVKLRGLHKITDPGGLKALTRLALSAVVISITAGDDLPKEIFEFREHTAKFVDVSHPKWRLTGITLSITTLVSNITKNCLKAEERIHECVQLERKLGIIDREASPKWSYKRYYVKEGEYNDKTLNGYYDVYASRLNTQMWNVLRFMRIILCDEIIECTPDADNEVSKSAYKTAALVVQEICATVPQMVDCEGPARQRLPNGSKGSSHAHTLSHFLDVYILLLGLYAAAWSRACPPKTKRWIVTQLERMAEHFGMKEAASVAAILKKQDSKTRMGPWDVYRLIGSYAFAA